MKNFLKICACFMCIFVFSGCKKALNEESASINPEINSNATINYGGKKYEVEIVRTPEGATTLKFISPENLAGTTFTFNGDKYEVSRKELVGTFTNEPFANGRFLSKLIKILASTGDKNNLKLKESKEGETTYEGKIDGENFNLTTDSSGRILSIEMPEQDMNVKIA